MCTDAYKEWKELFDKEVTEVWKSERKELQRTVMLLWTLQKELKSVSKNLESEVSSLRQQLIDRDCLELKKKSAVNSDRKKSPNSGKENRLNLSLLETRSNSFVSNLTEAESPDLFRNIDPNRESKPDNEKDSSRSMIIDLSLSEDDKREIDTSPTLISKRRKDPRRIRSRPPPQELDDSFKMNENPNFAKRKIFLTPGSDLEMSVIDSTPDLKGRKVKSVSKVRELAKKKVNGKRRNLTLTQIYSNPKQPKSNIDHRLDTGDDSDETFFEANKSPSKLGITELLNIINEDESNEDCDSRDADEMDSTQEVEQFSKGLLLDDSAHPEEESLQKKRKIAVLPEPVVRGHARKDLNGFACQQCKNFYGHMNLSPDELQRKMDECSKHRYKYRPPEDTLPGFWDMTIASPK